MRSERLWAWHLAGLEGGDHGKIQPALAGRDVGDVNCLGRRGGIDTEAPLQHVRGDGACVGTVRRARLMRPLRTPCNPSSCMRRRTRLGLME